MSIGLRPPASVLPQAGRPTAARSLWSDAWLRLRRNPGAIAGFVLVLIFVVCAVFAPLVATHDPLEGDLTLLRGGIPPGPSTA